MEKCNLKNFILAMMILVIIINLISASNDYFDSSEQAQINEIKQEILLGLIEKLRTDLNDVSVDVVEKRDNTKRPKSRKTKSNFKNFNMNTLFNPSGLWEYNKI